jgi:hypothetical protein
MDFKSGTLKLLLKPLRPIYSCERKVRYGHMATAQKASVAMNRKTGDSFDSYHCEYCKGFHIGHSRRRQ